MTATPRWPPASLSLSLRLPRQAGQAEMSPTSISICIYPAHDPGLFTMLQEPQITPIITRSLTACRSRYQKINMLMYQPGVQSVTAQLYSHATCLADWIGPGAWHMTHTHTHSSLEESWRAVVSITELVKITLVQMAVQHYQTSQESAECLQQCSCNSKHSRVLIALLHWEGAVGIKERQEEKKKSDAKQSICEK